VNLTDNIPALDLRRIIATLEECAVDYLVVGGSAALAYGAERVTEDIDVVIQRSRENRERLARALKTLNARLRVGGMTDDEARTLPVVIDHVALDLEGTSTWMTDAGPLDILAGLAARGGRVIRFEELAPRSQVLVVDNLVIKAANLADIIESKEVANRPKDLEALPELRALRDEADARRQ